MLCVLVHCTYVRNVQIKAGGAAVLSCPAYFDEAQRGALLVAGEAAGVTVLDVLDEPVVSERRN